MGNSKIELILVSCFFCFLCWGFYNNDQNMSVSQLSTDQWNILPVAMKYSNPSLFKHDLFASDIEDLDYYTPWFVKPLLLFSYLNEFDFFKGLNSFHLLIQLIYCFLWFFLFQKITNNTWLSALMVMIVRGVLWPPGNELWGIASVWTLLPRTVYSAFIPLPIFLVFKIFEGKEFNFRASMLLAFITGLIGNFHPVSGLVFGFCILLSHYILVIITYKLKNIIIIFLGVGLMFFFLLGLSPFIYNYITEILVIKPSDPDLFNKYLSLRIGNQFLEPLSIFEKLFSLKWLMFLSFPIITIIIIRKFFDEKLDRIIYFTVILFFVVLLINLLVIPIENSLNYIIFNGSLKLAFQLVRNIKYLIVPTYLAYMMLVLFLLRFVYNSFGSIWYYRLSILFFTSFLCFSFLSRSFEFKIPLLSDDILRSALPDYFTPLPYTSYKTGDLDEAISWISKKTSINDAFVGPTVIRPGAQRSLVFDFKGASMLIEGNPDKFVKWAKMKTEIDDATNNRQLIFLFKKWDVDYWLTRDKVDYSVKEIKRFGVWILYEIQ